jgi:hypothetical protein
MGTLNINMEQYLGNPISKVCKNGYHKDSDNHCAHFVSHVLGLRFGFKCRDMTGKGELANAANIRVHEIFAKCPSVGKWNDRPEKLDPCLAFVTSASNVKLKNKFMNNHPRKHIGIFHKGKIYHYSNSKDKVVEQTPEAYAKHYSGSDISVYYGAIPE